MTVAELIAELQKHPQDSVCYSYDLDEYKPITYVGINDLVIGQLVIGNENDRP